MDRHDIEAGESWRAAISHAIDECDAFLVVLSPQCVTSKNVVKELSIAESRDRHIIPLMCQNCEIPPAMEYQLSGLQQIEFCGVAFEAALERVVQRYSAGVRPVGPTPEINASARALLTPRTPQPASPSYDATPSSPQAGAAFQQAQAPQAAFAPQDLAQMLCGRWNVQIGSAYVGVAQAMVDMYPNGGFQGQIVGPTGLIAVTGLWQVTPMGQLVLNGQQTIGWATTPYAAVIQFSQVSPSSLSGITGLGEQLVWTRIG